MDEEVREITLEELLEDSFVINEEKLISTITEKELKKYTKIRKDLNVNKKTGLTVSFYIKEDHVIEQFEKRFDTGTEQVNRKFGSKFKFKDLPEFQSYDFKKFKEVYFSGCLKIINNHKLNRNGYFIISESTRMIIPVALLKVEGENRKVFITHSVFHTSMTNIDVFKWKGKSYKKTDVFVEYRSFNDFTDYILETEEYKLKGVEADFLNKGYIELFEEGDKIFGEYPIVVIE
jgi:hypothetical protein